MGRTNNIWSLSLFYDKEKKDYIKTIETNTLRDLAYLINCELYDVSNFYHKITKPKGLFEYMIISKL